MQALKGEECLEEVVYYASLLPSKLQISLLCEVLSEVEELSRPQCVQYAAMYSIPVSHVLVITLLLKIIAFHCIILQYCIGGLQPKETEDYRKFQIWDWFFRFFSVFFRFFPFWPILNGFLLSETRMGYDHRRWEWVKYFLNHDRQGVV